MSSKENKSRTEPQVSRNDAPLDQVKVIQGEYHVSRHLLREEETQRLTLNESGLLPVVVQNDDTDQVLMAAWMDEEALKRTLKGPHAWFYSRSRKKLWLKGETSGNFLQVVSVAPDCDNDFLLLRVKPTGPVCHTNEASCFHKKPLLKAPTFYAQAAGPGVLKELEGVLAQRRRDMPEDSYTAELFKQGTGRIAQKVIEEAGEVAIAACIEPNNLAPEIADLLYHTMVLLTNKGIDPEEVWRILNERRDC